MAVKDQKLKKYNNVAGVEISENCIIVSEIKFVKNNLNLTSGFRLDVPVFQDINNTVSLFKQSLRASNIKTKDFAFSLSMQYFKLFPVPIPKTIPRNEIDSIILQEGNINLNNDVAVWMPLNNTQRQDPDGVARYDVLGISMPKNIMSFVNLLCKQCALKPLLITPSFFGSGAFLGNNVANNLESTLWISQIRSEFIVWSGQEPVYEHLFLTHQMSEQVFQLVNYIQTQLPGSQVTTIYTCGPYSKETNLSQIPYNIQPFLLPPGTVDAGNVLQRVPLNEIIVSLGLAFSASNNFPYFCPNLLNPIKQQAVSALKDIFKSASKVKVSSKIKIPLEPALAKFIFASVLIIVLSLILNIFIQSFLVPGVQANQSIFKNKMLISQAHLAKVLNYEKTNKIFNLKIDYLSELIDKRKQWSKILKEIADMTPKGLWIDRLEIANKNIDVFGRALDVDSVANFSINLNYTAKLLSNAQIVALRKFQEEGIDIIEFQISLKLKEFQSALSEKTKGDMSHETVF